MLNRNKRRFWRQPAGPVEINWANPLGRNLRAAFNGSDLAFDVVNRKRFIPNNGGAPTTADTQLGLGDACVGAGFSTIGWAAPEQSAGSESDLLYDIQPPMTAFIIATSTGATPATGAALTRANASGGPHWALYFRNFSLPARRGTSFQANSVSYETDADYFDPFDGRPHVAAAAIDTVSNVTVWGDLVQRNVTNTSSITFTYTYDDVAKALNVGAYYYSGSGTTILAGLATRAWGDDDYYALYDNPWQIFKPVRRRAYFLPSGAVTPTHKRVPFYLLFGPGDD